MQHDNKLGPMKLTMLSRQAGYHGTSILILIWAATPETAARRAAGLRPSFYSLRYLKPYGPDFFSFRPNLDRHPAPPTRVTILRSTPRNRK
jgi:hypothetical protein